MTLIVLQGLLHLGMYKGPGGRELWEGRWKGTRLLSLTGKSPRTCWESFHQFVPRGLLFK